MSTKSYDYVIVGAGSAGCTLARRLTEDPEIRVLLLEAGGWDRDPWIKIPLGWGRILEKRLHDWMYFTEPEPNADGRRIECARGKVVGGSSSINAMAYVRGNPGDYDRWAASGLAGWSYADVLPYFRRQESWEGEPGPYRGGDGPLGVGTAHYDDPIIEACLAAGRALQFPATADYNGAQQEGLGRMQQTIRNGRRCSAAEAYLRPALSRPNLTVETGALASRIVLEAGRAAAVEFFSHRGATTIARADREIILSGGVINSPQLLMLSGIGDPEALAAHGIPALVELPGVGRNLQDHLSVAADYARSEPGPFVAMMRLDRVALSLARAYCLGTGPFTETPSGWTGFVKSRPDVELPDIQFLFRAAPGGAGPWLAPFKPAFADGFSLRAVMLRPESRGDITLASADPRAPVRIRQNFLATDRRTIRNGLRLARRIVGAAPLSAFAASELSPGADKQSDADLDAYIRATAATAHHPLGTCKMGPASDRMAVVDAELRLYGVEGLRIVDASVMPDLVGGNINAPVIMIAEKAADLIRGREPLPAAP